MKHAVMNNRDKGNLESSEMRIVEEEYTEERTLKVKLIVQTYKTGTYLRAREVFRK